MYLHNEKTITIIGTTKAC